MFDLVKAMKKNEGGKRGKEKWKWKAKACMYESTENSRPLDT